MEYTKPALTFEQQADLLLQRGLLADKEELIKRLRCVNYYRVTGYLYPFRCGTAKRLTRAIYPDPDPDRFMPGTTLDDFWIRYTYDRRLRLLAFEAIERIENALKAQMAEIYSNTYGPFGLEQQSNFPGFRSAGDYEKFVECLAKEYSRSREDFVDHFKSRYGDAHVLPPLWAMIEVMSFGSVVTLYRNSDEDIQQRVADYFGIKRYMLASWLLTLYTVRNLCAHHSRLYNRSLQGVNLKIWKEWERSGIPRDRVFGLLCAICELLRHVSSDRDWAAAAAKLMRSQPDVTRRMGAPVEWEKLPLWKDV